MANETYSTACSIPSPMDVLSHPLTLFTNSILSGSPDLLNMADQTNYKSFIAAIAMFANREAPWSIDVTETLNVASNRLSHVFSDKNIEMSNDDKCMLNFLCNIICHADDFTIFLECFSSFVGSI